MIELTEVTYGRNTAVTTIINNNVEVQTIYKQHGGLNPNFRQRFDDTTPTTTATTAITITTGTTATTSLKTTTTTITTTTVLLPHKDS